MSQDWSEKLHSRVARAVKSARGSRSAQWLADETGRLGFPISRAAIANYESGRKRGLDLTELLVIAAALGVPPLVLLFPDVPDGPVEVLPGLEIASWDAAAWFSGERGSICSATANSPEYERICAVRQLSAQLDAIAQVHDWGREILSSNGGPMRPDDPDVRALKRRLEALRDDVARLEGLIRATGGVLAGDEERPGEIDGTDA